MLPRHRLTRFIISAFILTHMPTTFGDDMIFKPCPDSPNCISSQAPIEDSHYTPPISFRDTDTEQTAYQRLLKILSSMPRTTIITKEDNHYISATNKTFLGFVDDLEFYINSEKRQIDLRSASRLGYYDFGKNRSRIAALIEDYHNASE